MSRPSDIEVGHLMAKAATKAIGPDPVVYAENELAARCGKPLAELTRDFSEKGAAKAMEIVDGLIRELRYQQAEQMTTFHVRVLAAENAALKAEMQKLQSHVRDGSNPGMMRSLSDISRDAEASVARWAELERADAVKAAATQLQVLAYRETGRMPSGEERGVSAEPSFDRSSDGGRGE